MAIKVRCKECSAVMTVSDKARGRVVKCKKCDSRVPVSTGARRNPSTAVPPSNPENLFDRIDLKAAADARRRICPACATAVSDEDVQCQKCGVDIETGILSEYERKRRARKGPPPEEFYGHAWTNSWKFLKANHKWAVRTAIVWGITATMAICAGFSIRWYVDGREMELWNSADGMIEVSDNQVFIDLRANPEDGEAFYDGKRYTMSSVGSDRTLALPGPRMGAIRSPPCIFWFAILGVAVLGFGGWAWTMVIQIVDITMAGSNRIKRFQTDLFASMAAGFRSIFWPAVLLAPLIWIPGVIWYFGGSQIAVGIACATILLVPLFTFLPAALIHMAQPYTYRGWLITWMSIDLAKTFLPTMYVGAMLLFLVLLIPLGSAVLALVFWSDIANFYTIQVENRVLIELLGYEPQNALNFFEFTFYRLPLIGVISFVGCFVVFGILAFPAIFMMRVYGLFGRYFRPELSLLFQQTALEPAGFGPRFVAFLVDCVLMAVMAVTAWFVAIFATKIFGFLYNFSEYATGIMYLILGSTIQLILWAIYFSTWESGQNRATLGKVALRLIVLQNDDQPVTSRQGALRTVYGVLTVLTVFAGFVMCAFRSDRRALHDLMSKTKVVWRGEDVQA